MVKTTKEIIFQYVWVFSFLAILLTNNIFITPESELNIPLGVVGFIILMGGFFVMITPYLQFIGRTSYKKGENFFNMIDLMDTGVYGIVRHPQNLGWAIVTASIILVAQNIISIPIVVLTLILIYLGMVYEEKQLITKYSEKYIDYTKKVPRWIFF